MSTHIKYKKNLRGKWLFNVYLLKNTYNIIIKMMQTISRERLSDSCLLLCSSVLIAGEELHGRRLQIPSFSSHIASTFGFILSVLYRQSSCTLYNICMYVYVIHSKGNKGHMIRTRFNLYCWGSACQPSSRSCHSWNMENSCYIKRSMRLCNNWQL